MPIFRRNWKKWVYWYLLESSLESLSLCFFDEILTPGNTKEPESYGEGLASHTDPESCTVVREDEREALIGACAGELLSREITCPGCRRCSNKRKATPCASIWQEVWGPRAVGDPLHAQKHRTREPGDPVFARRIWRGGPHGEV